MKTNFFKKKKSFLTYSQKNWLFRIHVVFLEVRRSLTVGKVVIVYTNR